LKKKKIVELTPEERDRLEALTRRCHTSARRMKRALILLAADEGDKDEEIAAKVRVHRVTVEDIRKRFVPDGLDAALSERPRPGKARLLDGRQEHNARVYGIARPEGGKLHPVLEPPERASEPLALVTSRGPRRQVSPLRAILAHERSMRHASRFRKPAGYANSAAPTCCCGT
jgi:hypothetical protein